MRTYNQKIEDALLLIQATRFKEAADHLSTLVEGEDKNEVAAFIEAVLTENAKERAETRETLKTFMSSITWRISQGYGFR
jgi:hypothetical protein